MRRLGTITPDEEGDLREILEEAIGDWIQEKGFTAGSVAGGFSLYDGVAVSPPRSKRRARYETANNARGGREAPAGLRARAHY